MFAGAVFVSLATSLGGSAPEPETYRCPKVETAPVIDGRLDDPAWGPSAWTSAFVDIEGDAKPRPRFRTRAKMAWDDEFFYVGAELEEPHVSGTITEHDEVIFRDNDFEVFIDPDGDNHEYYEIEINALNAEWDLFLPKPYRDGGPAVDSWEVPGLRHAVAIDGTINDPSDRDVGWTVEIAIPWTILGEHANRPAPPGLGDRWRVNFSRVEWPYEVVEGTYRKPEGVKEDNWVWSLQGVIDMHRPERWGIIEFAESPGPPPAVGPDEPARMALMAVYEAERAVHAETGRWTHDLDAIRAKAPSLGDFGGFCPTILLTLDGYEATIDLDPAEGDPYRLTIRQDGRLRSESTTVSDSPPDSGRRGAVSGHQDQRPEGDEPSP